jgi:hypothetical protein
MTAAMARPAPLLAVPASERDEVQVVQVVPVTLAAPVIRDGSMPAPDGLRVPDASPVPAAAWAPGATWAPAAAPALRVASWRQGARHLALTASAARSTSVGSRRR